MGKDEPASVAHVIPRSKRPYVQQETEASVFFERYATLAKKPGAGLLMTSQSGWNKDQLAEVGLLMRHGDAAVAQNDWKQGEAAFFSEALGFYSKNCVVQR